jgi:hypothetical protein
VSDHNIQLALWRQTDHLSFDRSVQVFVMTARAAGGTCA